MREITVLLIFGKGLYRLGRFCLVVPAVLVLGIYASGLDDDDPRQEKVDRLIMRIVGF